MHVVLEEKKRTKTISAVCFVVQIRALINAFTAALRCEAHNTTVEVTLNQKPKAKLSSTFFCDVYVLS